MPKKYYGVIPPIVTPIDENENVDESAFRKLIDYNIAGGLHGLFIAGTNGETMALTQKERNRAIKIALDQVAGRVPVMCGVMDTSTRRVIENIKALEDMGGKCAVITPIFYDRHTSQDETVRHFEKILKETNIDLMIYNIPPFTGIQLTPDTIIRISELGDKVAGVKDSSGNFTGFIQLLSRFRDTPFCVLQGVAAHGLPSILFGADGFVPAIAAAFPELYAKSYDAALTGDLDLIWKYNELLREASKVLGMCKNATAATKYAVSLRGIGRKDVIMPQDTIQPEDEIRIQAQMKKIDNAFAALKESL